MDLSHLSAGAINRICADFEREIAIRPGIVYVSPSMKALAAMVLRRANAWQSMVPHRASYWRYLQKRGAR